MLKVLLAAAIFLITYAVISSRSFKLANFGRPSGALLGAVLMVVCGVLTPEAAYRSIDWNVLVLLLGMMIVVEYLFVAGFFEVLTAWVLKRARSPRRLLLVLIFVSGILSALFVNDTVCLVLTPLLVQVIRRAKLAALPYVLALAMSSNIGSVMTFTGNPQNMIIGLASGIPYANYMLFMFPIGVACLFVCFGILCLCFHREISASAWQTVELSLPHVYDRPLILKTLLVLVLAMTGFLANINMPLVAISAAVTMFFLGKKKPEDILARIDWTLLLMFGGLFVVVEGINTVDILNRVYAFMAPHIGRSDLASLVNFSGLTMLLSNLVSNVPYVMIAVEWVKQMADHSKIWYVLALSSTFSGNLMVLGSVANLIVLEQAKEVVSIGFREYLKVGLVMTVSTIAVGLFLIWILLP